MLVDTLGQAVRTQLVDGLLTDLLQAVRFLRVYTITPHENYMQEPRAPSTVESRYLEQPREKQKSSRKRGFQIIDQCQTTMMTH